MENLRIYGNRPYNVAVVHGGPGALGGLAPVAREIAAYNGVLEPVQTEDSVRGQAEELYTVLVENADLPVVLVGFSWGAWLSIITAAWYPGTVRKLILVGSGSFEQKYAESIFPERLKRLGEEERTELLGLAEAMDGLSDDKAARMMELLNKADIYEALPQKSEGAEFDYHIYRSVWQQAEKMRISGELLELASGIRCPVVAAHGDYDPHLAEGVREPLSRVLKDFRFILLEKCGHTPWLERNARDKFYDIIRDEIT